MTTSKFQGTALNKDGDTWRFVFHHENWNGVQAAADAALTILVAEDPLHQKHGPWIATAIDRSA